MDRLKIEKSGEAQPHFLYDLSLGLPDRQRKRKLFESGKDLANYLGVPHSRIYKNRAANKRVYSPRFDRWYAVRMAGETALKDFKMAIVNNGDVLVYYQEIN